MFFALQSRLKVSVLKPKCLTKLSGGSSRSWAMTSNRLLKNTHLLRYAYPSSLQRTCMYASFLRISRALHLDVFEQPEENYFFNNLLIK